MAWAYQNGLRLTKEPPDWRTITTTTAAAARDVRGLIWVTFVSRSRVSLGARHHYVAGMIWPTAASVRLADDGDRAWRLDRSGRRQRYEHVIRPRHRREIMVRTRSTDSVACRRTERAACRVAWRGGYAFMNCFREPACCGAHAQAPSCSTSSSTVIRKRTTSLNIVIGGAAGAMQPMIGWAAVTNTVSIEALLMFAIVTTGGRPPHFWASPSLLERTQARGIHVPVV